MNVEDNLDSDNFYDFWQLSGCAIVLCHNVRHISKITTEKNHSTRCECCDFELLDKWEYVSAIIRIFSMLYIISHIYLMAVLLVHHIGFLKPHFLIYMLRMVITVNICGCYNFCIITNSHKVNKFF